MLTALELYGFKSFPDRTRFEFPEGITVVVGPNGSGKSNIVDGIKWVLGEQSPKSLRGKEMADVIFKGTTGTGGRKASNTAEASLIFDNTSRRLPLDQDDIQITRRVYRSGEGEYLINGEPCRLKDIRNLIRGTGVGTDAYSLIEQGKVDSLLKASPKERRAMFEEAAGISRFKAKKVEAERRLARVETNLVRLADIVEEVGNRYRKIQSQATKAAKYKQYTERLQSLRTYVGAKDWRDFSAHLEKIESDKKQLTTQATDSQKELDKLEEDSRQHEVQLSQWSSKILEFQQGINGLIQQITERQSNIALNQSRTDDLKVQETTHRDSLSRTNTRLEHLTKRFAETESYLSESTATTSDCEQKLAVNESEIEKLQGTIASLKAESESKQQRQGVINNLIGEIGKQLSAADSRLAMTTSTSEKLVNRLGVLAKHISAKSQQLQTHQDNVQKLQNDAAQKDGALQQSRETLQKLRNDLEERQKQLAEKRRAQTGATQRAEVIQELENRLEGVDSGVKELLERSARDEAPWLKDVVGLVADVIKVNVQHAELVDLALGDFTRCLIVNGRSLLDRLVSGQLKPSGRVRLIQLNEPPTLGTQLNVDLSHEEGVVGRLDGLVQTEPEFQNLVKHLLGGTFLVKTLADAFRLQNKSGGRVRFVTLEGDVLESDGTVIAGPRTAAGGIVSRRSELRALHREIHTLTGEIQEQQQLHEQQKQKAKQLDESVQSLFNENSELSTRLNEQKSAANLLTEQIATLKEEQEQVETESAELTSQIESLTASTAADRNTLTAHQNEISSLMSFLQNGSQKMQGYETQLAEAQRVQTSLKVQLAKSQQQREDARNNHEQMSQQLAECRQSISETRSALAGMLWTRRASAFEIKDSTSLLSKLETDRGGLDGQLKQLVDQRTQAENSRRDVTNRMRELRDQVRSCKDKQHEIELRESQLSMERTQLAQRLHDDYGIAVADLDADSDEIDEDREAIDQEISQLRKSIGNIGSVNMDALLELEEMQERYEALDAQYQDLVQSREALEKIIRKINDDSRRLFEETLTAIRANFQKLFRQTFGGGRADLVLEEDVDILEAGIDIMATPPGKPEFNNSLLSGGERALTAVSLLMAIFQFRPSPFCVLDEVDAPFDEANVGRFIDVLKSFLDWTKFVIVTHSKVTMTAATTLYGVTMQESGVSKRVSVQFEDVSEDGSISEEAVKRDSGDEKVA